MSRPCWSGLLVCGIFLAAPVLSAQARQDPQPQWNDWPRHISHDLDEFDGIGDPEQAVTNRLRHAKLQDSEELIQKLLKNKDLADLLRQQLKTQLNIKHDFTEENLKGLVQQIPKNPELLKDAAGLRDKVQKLLKEKQVGTPEQAKRLADMLGPMVREHKDKLLSGKLPFRNGQRTPGVGIPADGGPGLQETPPPPPKEPSQSASWTDSISRQLGNWADYLQKMDRGQESDALRDAINNLNRFGWGDTKFKIPRAATSRLDALARMARTLSSENLAFKPSKLPRPSWLPSLPPMPRMRLPTVASSWSVSSSPSSSTLVAASTGLVWLLVLALLGVLAWKSGSWFRSNTGFATGQAWRLGGWPVAPAQIKTRGDLVRAFEFLALLVLGPPAATCHHHELAERLGQHGGALALNHREAANRLAELYEKARYAPEQAGAEIQLTPNDQAVARQALCILAGVAHA